MNKEAMMKRFAAAALLALAGSAHADCVCRCVDGQIRAICSNPLDLPPICGPANGICPIVPPSLPPMQLQPIPPLGTTQCWQAQVANPNTGRYEWRTVCR